MAVIDNRTVNRDYQLPNGANDLQDDVLRLIASLNAIDIDVASALTGLAGKAATSHSHAIADVTGLQAALDGKMSSGASFTLDSLSDVNTSSATDGHFIRRVNGVWVPTFLDAAYILSGTLDVARVPSLAADKIISGTFDAARIPNLPASKITSGTISDTVLPKATAAEVRTGTETAKFPTAAAAKEAAVGKFTVGIGSGGFKPTATSGAGIGSWTGTNGINLDTLDFDGGAAEYAQALIPMPKSWNAGAIVVRPIWFSTSGSGTVGWVARAVSFSHDDALDIAMSTGGSQTTTQTMTATGDVNMSGTISITPGNSPAKGDVIVLELSRDAVNDTQTADARLIGVVIEYTTDGLTDD